ncbi:hypothetical protein EON63_21325 [archaeon]|nr:MAG: hypothetical protein EON63_21325 [archaeon]
MSSSKAYLFAAALAAGSVVSIGISAWQYKNGNGDLQTTDDFDFKEECNDFPYNYMKREFFLVKLYIVHHV